jgi:HK97 family phage major capsid protein
VKKLSLLGMMALHMAAFQAKAAQACFYEKREEPTIKSVADALDKIATTFEEYKKVNDQRLDAVKSGGSTADMDAKLAKMDKDIEGLSEAKTRLEKIEGKLARPGAFSGGSNAGNDETAEAAEYRGAFIDWMRSPKDGEREQRCVQARKAMEAKARQTLESKSSSSLERRAAQTVTTTGASGGFALPEQIERTIARLSVDISPIRSIATVRQVGTSDYKELFDVNGAAFEWLGEADTRNQTNTPDMAEVAPTFGMASAKPQASEESLDDLFFDVENWLTMSAAEAIAQGEGAAYVSGNGTKKPTGFLAGPTPVTTTDSSRAFGTLQYIASGQAAAMPSTPDTFYDIVYALRARYRANAKWVTSKLVLAAMRKYKEATTNAYMWQPGLSAGQPSLFAGYEVVEAEDMPAVGAGAFSLAFGDFREGYLIADRVGMRITRDEITTPGFVKFYIRKRTGGKLRNTQAIKLLKIAAS